MIFHCISLLSVINRSSSVQLSDEVFEKLLDLLEKEAYRQVGRLKITNLTFLQCQDRYIEKQTTGVPDRSVKDFLVPVFPPAEPCCDICTDSASDPSNALVTCTSCQIGYYFCLQNSNVHLVVHRGCYAIPESLDNWVCAVCSKKRAKMLVCSRMINFHCKALSNMRTYPKRRSNETNFWSRRVGSRLLRYFYFWVHNISRWNYH